jgi:Protein of unknown function (DUF2587)/Bacterial regulatory proteins, tetR family
MMREMLEEVRHMPLDEAGRRRLGAIHEATVHEILESARARFAGHGYDGATIGSIAADAGVDPAFVHHFYGTKGAMNPRRRSHPTMGGWRLCRKWRHPIRRPSSRRWARPASTHSPSGGSRLRGMDENKVLAK